MSFEQQGGTTIYHVPIRREGEVIHCNEKLQEEITDFCNGWMKNIQEQQFTRKG